MLLLWAAAAACAAARPCAPAPGAVTINGRKVKACGRSACGGGPSSRCGCNATEPYGGAASVTLALQHAKPLPLAKFGGCYPLAPADFARSVAHLGARRLRRFLAKCARGDAVHVLVVGGSVAVGYAADGPPSSAALVHWLEKTFPRAKIERTSLAQSGTDSFFFAAHLERLSHKADLVIVDYLTNDLGILDGDTTAHTMRAVVEKILRAALALPRAPAALLVGILRTVELTTARNFEFQDEVYQPLAEAYDVTLVSYRDAIWPDFATPPPAAIYETRKGSHPTWYIHQLIADAMVYACALVMNDLGDAAEAPPAIPMAPIFRDEAVDALSTCREPLTHLVGDGLRDGVAGAAPARWAWWDLRPTKEGWQYVSADEDFEAALREGTGNGTARRLQRGKRSTNNGAGARAAAKARQGARQRARARLEVGPGVGPNILEGYYGRDGRRGADAGRPEATNPARDETARASVPTRAAALFGVVADDDGESRSVLFGERGVPNEGSAPGVRSPPRGSPGDAARDAAGDVGATFFRGVAATVRAAARVARPALMTTPVRQRHWMEIYESSL